MKPFLKAGSIGTATFSVVILCFLFLPYPWLQPEVLEEEEVAAIEQRGNQYFEMIAEGKNLDRPFPEMAIREDNALTPAKIELGRMLFFDPILSADNASSCATCHHPDLGFSDNRARSMGFGGQGIGPARTGGVLLPRNTPTIWNAAYNIRQFWDGRASDLEEQADGPIHHPDEMAQNQELLVEELAAIPAYVDLFEAAFGTPELTYDQVTYAIGAFERTVITSDSRYDQYARGDREAMTPAERRGLNLFRSLKTRCFECHNLPTFANPDFKVIGVPEPEGVDPDLGRAEIVGPGYEGAFKVPTLRNVALTAPYMHNGVFETLAEVVDFYATGGGTTRGMDGFEIDDKIRPFALSGTERDDLVAFMHALTDESNKPAVPSSVPSGLPVVPRLENQSPEMAAERARVPAVDAASVNRQGNHLIVAADQRIQDAIDVAQPGDTVFVEAGVYHETLALDVSQVTLIGEHTDSTRAVLDGQEMLSDGMVGSGSDIVIEGFEIRNYTANGLMIDLATNITFRDLHVENTGLYGVYPVEVVGVVVEGSTVIGARDAGIYVGQSKDIIVRNNVVHGNVTGIEIENSVNALVDNNEVYDNAGGILVFLLPNNPSKISTGCVVQNNKIYNNNHVNFADPNAIVASVPSGTGVMILAADDVRVTQNEILNNKSAGVAILGLATLFGEDKEFDVDPTPENNWIYDNQIGGNGNAPDAKVAEAGFDGADLIWDMTGLNNSWDQADATKLPYTLPESTWSDFRRRANYRLWQTAAAML
ncbi:MAG: parallel beta-helix domain-containing protein [Bacteroidota bacterium]